MSANEEAFPFRASQDEIVRICRGYKRAHAGEPLPLTLQVSLMRVGLDPDEIEESIERDIEREGESDRD